jgi:hypothetical protein
MTANARPTVHLNGSSGAELLGALRDATAAIRIASVALRTTAPHGRDYYPQGPIAFNVARDEHYARQEALNAIESDLSALAAHVYAAQRLRGKA